ncbi:hypothetical protein HMPREF0737_00787 [Rothia mucilaginosa M508]|uniref:Flavodoxin-like domain-containing protein n=1 Tax=Rothia mucilaginosa M508 TaxID=563033 RepID=G5ER77_9MICC|nr:flavodoxin domain-containing protein [Rothia mucilaginosa]EHB88475.1 hypothetical protein HMPREF0737_00787 [Rothia mucilaginosa M508]
MTTRVLIIFGSTYGYTEQYATWLAEDLRALPQAPEVETVPASKVTPEQAEAFDAFVIAGSDYGGFLNGAPALRKKILPIIAPKKNRTAFFTVSFTGEYSKKLLDKAVAKSYHPRTDRRSPRLPPAWRHRLRQDFTGSQDCPEGPGARMAHG